MAVSKNKYVDFVTDEHLLKCISNLYDAYLESKKGFTKSKFYGNKVDTFKLTFDSKFNDISEEDLIKLEMARQIGKSVNNAFANFHRQILSGVEGYEFGNYGFDIKAKDDSVFSLFLFEEVSQNYLDAIFEKLAKQANIYKAAKCFFVDFTSTASYCEKWVIKPSEDSTISHKQVFRISVDKFYEIVCKREKALPLLNSVLRDKTNAFEN